MLSGFNILPHGFEGQTEVNIKMVGTSDVLITLRDQSFITKRGGGGIQNGKIMGPKLVASPLPHQDGLKLSMPPLPFKEVDTFTPLQLG